MKAGTNFDIARSNHTLKDIVDITDTPDIDMWNKMEKQIDKGKKGSVDIIIKKDQEEGEEKPMSQPATSASIGLAVKGNENSIIDPANKKDVAKVISSGKALTDKIEPFSIITDNKTAQQESEKREKKNHHQGLKNK
jgi:protein-tyrosine-phosphatase